MPNSPEKKEDRESRTADEMESEMEDREEARREKERDDQQDLMQSVQLGTHDSEKLGVNWPPSYRNLKKRKPTPKSGK